MESIRLVIPGIPISANHYKKPRRYGRGYYVTPEAERFKADVFEVARGRSVNGKRYGVDIAVFLGDGQKGDIDNFAKLCLDGLVQAGVIRTDAAVDQLTMRKARDREDPRTEITVRAI